MDRPGLSTSAEDGACGALRERVAGLVLFALALYTAWEAAIEDAQGRTVLPLGRRGKGKLAIHGSLLEQVKQAPTEPGVRAQL